MTMLSMKKKCQVCGNVFSFNPSVGKINCPRCGALLGVESDGLAHSLKEKLRTNKDNN